MDKALVSIIVPVYNGAEYLRECLNSVARQTLRNIEIICVNDGSGDDSLAIMEEYAARDKRFRIISKPNGGYGHLMNVGLDAATGKYVGIVEADDYISISMYERLCRIAEKSALDFIRCDFYRFMGTEENREYALFSSSLDSENYRRILEPGEDLRTFRYPMNTWAGIYRVSFLRHWNIRYNETPGASFQDNGFWFQIMCRTKRGYYLDQPFYMNRRDNPGSSVYSREKVYCANEEYTFIKSWMQTDPVLWEKYSGIYHVIQYHNYYFTLQRIHEEYKRDYLHVISEEFNQAEQAGVLKQEFFTPDEWNLLRWIMREPDEFYYEIVKKEVKVSVIIPVYNGEKHLRTCLDSVLGQSLKEIEIICVNDGSTDRSNAILQAYAKRDFRMKVITQPHSNAGAARNRGMDAAEGYYLSFLDCDDYFDQDMLYKAYYKALADNADICIFQSNFYDELEGKTVPCHFSLRLGQLPEERPFSGWDIRSNPFKAVMGWAWDKLFRRSFVLNNRLRFQEQRTTNDLCFVFTALLKAQRITTVNEPLATQRRNIAGSLSATREYSWECIFYALTGLRDELVHMGVYERYKQSFINYSLHNLLWQVYTIKDASSGKKIFQALKNNWFDALEITAHPEDYFDDKSEFYSYQKIMELSDNDYWPYLFSTLTEEITVLRNRPERETASNAQSDLEYMRNSVSFRIGRAITFLPRLVRGGFIWLSYKIR